MLGRSITHHKTSQDPLTLEPDLGRLTLIRRKGIHTLVRITLTRHGQETRDTPSAETRAALPTQRPLTMDGRHR
jgi:hypothetical protein